MEIIKGQNISLLVTISIQIIVISCSRAEESTSGVKWVAPDAWSRSHNNTIKSNLGRNSSQRNSVAENDINFHNVFYAKLIRFIFNRKHMIYDESTATFSRSIIFKITTEQLQILEQSVDPRDWDSVLTNILPNAISYEFFEKGSFFGDVFQYVTNLLTFLEVRFSLLLLVLVMAILYINRRYKYGIVTTIVVGSFLFGFIHKYYECNREIEIKELLNNLEIKENYCESLHEKNSFWSWFRFENNKQKCEQHLRDQNKIKLPYCQPIDVLLKYFREMIFEQIFFIIEKCMDVLSKCFDNVPFPYNYVAAVMFSIILPQIIFMIIMQMTTLITKINVWNGVHPIAVTDQPEDRLSGENLKLFLQQATSVSRNPFEAKTKKHMKNEIVSKNPDRLDFLRSQNKISRKAVQRERKDIRSSCIDLSELFKE